jgi:methylenetetrahydrofolate dehydrogenase (NADP+)/methenyltetrahydrofolate cyclohydrolase
MAGAPVAEAIKNAVREEMQALALKPCLAVARVGEDAASAVYVGNKVKTSQELGFVSEHHHLSAEIEEKELLDLVESLNRREDVDGILVQLPLPRHINEKVVLESIDPGKDVDGFHPVNVGRLSLGQPGLAPCTPAGVMEMLKFYGVPLRGKNAVVVGRSNIVGKPMAQMLLAESATVTICHSATENLAEVTSRADILVAAIGKAAMIRAEHIKPGAVVIDVGMNSVSDPQFAREIFAGADLEKRLSVIEKRGTTLVGDVCPKDAWKKAGKFTPVPGGVGLLTVAMLMKNTLTASKRKQK